MNERNHSLAGSAGHSALQTPTRRVLVVDDDDVIRQLAAAMLKRSGYETTTAVDGAAGWKALSADRYDLLITDNDMPHVTGIELLQKLHAARMTLPVIMVTGMLPGEEFALRPWLQPDAILLKPFIITEFLDTVQQVLQVTCGARGQPASPLDWQRRPPTSGLDELMKKVTQLKAK